MLHQGEKEKQYKEEMPRCSYCFGPARGNICYYCMEEICRYMDRHATGGNHRNDNNDYKQQARSFPAKRHIIFSGFRRLATRFNWDHAVTVQQPCRNKLLPALFLFRQSLVPIVKKTTPHHRHKKSEPTPIKLVVERLLLKLQVN